MYCTELAPGDIRVLKIFPSRYHKAFLQCQLSVQPLKHATYEALSYVWGTSVSSEKIIVNEEEVTVTSNLLSALRHLRDSEATRTFWVDALCINQDDQDERSRQVRIMGDIYRNATVVFCWLGEAVDSDVMSFIQEMNKFCARESPPTCFEGSVSVQTSRGEGDEDTTLLGGPQVDHESLLQLLPKIKDLLDNEYFCRVWTIQEMVLARRVVVFCGHGAADWAGFDELFLEWLHNHGEHESVRHSIRMFLKISFSRASLSKAREEALVQRRGATGASLLDTLIKYRTRKTSDPRDKVFGLLELCSHPGFEADYTKTTEQVFQDVSRYIIERDQNLDVFSAIPTIGFNQRMKWTGFSPAGMAASALLELLHQWVRPFFVRNYDFDIFQNRLPSWVADWEQYWEWCFQSSDTDLRVYMFLDQVRSGLYNASCGSMPLVKFPETGRDAVELGGIFVDRVRGCHQTELPQNLSLFNLLAVTRCFFYGSTGHTRPTWDFWARNRPEKIPYDGKEGELTALLRTVSADQASNFICSLFCTGLAQSFWEEEIASLLANAAKKEQARLGEPSQEAITREQERYLWVTSCSSLCVTDSGYMGRVPLATREGDIIVVFAGGKVPFVLRYDSLTNSHSLIGDCCKWRLLSPEYNVDLSY